jgi:hypothetical protein
MAAEWGNILLRSFLDIVMLLWTLEKITEPRKDSVLRDDDQNWRQIAFEREKAVVDLFVFLLATHDDASQIMAVSLEKAKITIISTSELCQIASYTKTVPRASGDI